MIDLNSLIKRIRRRLGLQYYYAKLKGNAFLYAQSHNALKVFDASFPNFGDMLTPLILQKYGVIEIPTKKDEALLFCTGSIIERIPKEFTGYILGSGLIYDHTIVLPYAKFIALRGVLTRERLGAPKKTVLGDPGLLVDKLLKRRQNKKYVVGFVPHYVDKNDPVLKEISERFPDKIANIDIQQDPISVIKEIDKCEYILSSSLHGLITADSLGIPNAWILLSNKVLGKGFKFKDYASALNIKLEPNPLSGNENINDLINLTHLVPDFVECRKKELDKVFKDFREMLISKNRL
jgi:pyruvyltransferase